MLRGFEKISFKQFKEDIKDDSVLYESYTLPVRKTKASAGYDFSAVGDFTINPGETIYVPTGVKSFMQESEMLMLFVRSSTGFKYNVRLLNQVGIIDHDYYNNEDNEGHIWVGLENHGKKPYIVKKGEHFIQGIFTNYLTVSNEEEISTVRGGGIGSTSKEVIAYEE